ncbi:hypothetical protein AALA00_10260 [Lachnospiraceae bacterium 46-15]
MYSKVLQSMVTLFDYTYRKSGLRKLAGVAASAYNGVYDMQSRQFMKPFVQSYVSPYIRRIIIIKHMGGSSAACIRKVHAATHAHNASHHTAEAPAIYP